MVLENVSETISMKAGLEVLIVIKAANSSLASDLYWIVHHYFIRPLRPMGLPLDVPFDVPLV